MQKYLFLFIPVHFCLFLFRIIQSGYRLPADELHFGDIIYRRWHGPGIGES